MPYPIYSSCVLVASFSQRHTGCRYKLDLAGTPRARNVALQQFREAQVCAGCVCAMDVLCGGRVTQGAGHGGRGGYAGAKERHCADRGGDTGHFGVEQKQRRAELLDGCVSYRANPYVKGL